MLVLGTIKAMPNTMGGFKKIDGFLRNEKPRFGKHKQDITSWWFQKFLFSPLPGEMIQFDEHIFQMGWFNHQLDNEEGSLLPLHHAGGAGCSRSTQKKGGLQ